MLPSGFIVVAILLRFASGFSYFRATWQGKAHPSLVSWFFWSVTALIACIVQLLKGAGAEAFVTLAIGISPIAVCLASLHKRAYKISLSRSDKWCVLLTTLGIILWLLSKNPMTALYLSILADALSNIPTLLKSYRAPHTEHPFAYSLSIASMIVTLLTITNWELSHWLFTAYILAINTIIVLTIVVFSKLKGLRLLSKQTPQVDESA